MRLALLLPLATATIVACSPANDATPADSAATAAPRLSAHLSGACSAASRISRASLHIVIGRARTTTFPAPPQTPGTWQGCRLVGNAPARPDSTAKAPEALLQEALAAEGWTPDARFTASGPANSQFGMKRAAALCVASITHPGTTAPPTPGAPYRIEIRCTEASAAGG